MCLGGHLSQDLRQRMKELRNNSPTTNRQGGTDLLHISGSSGEGVSTVIVFVVVVNLLSLGRVALWFLWRCIRECNRRSDDEHDLRKTCRYEQKFSNLLDNKTDRRTRREVRASGRVSSGRHGKDLANAAPPELPVCACTQPERSREPSEEDHERLRQRRLEYW